VKIVATVTACKQVGQDSYRDIHISRVFYTSSPLQDIIAWAGTTLGKHVVHICDIQLSEHTSEGL